MAARPTEPLKEEHAIKTYRYLRIGMIGAVVVLAASILIERTKVDCWQTSISAYYYTPVRAIFVGSMIAVGFSLIAYKGQTTWEDVCLNFAGMLAPIVAIAPTTDVGRCWSAVPSPLPVTQDGSLANWVVTNIDNNYYALLIAGAFGLLVASIVAMVMDRKASLKEKVLATVEKKVLGTTVSLGVTAVALLVGWLLISSWDDFNTRAHGYAAVLMFALLIGAIIAVAFEHRREQDTRWFRIYSAVAGGMVVGGIVIAWARIGGDHTVAVLEGYEITLFALYWLAQTTENWHERVVDAEVVDTRITGSVQVEPRSRRPTTQ